MTEAGECAASFSSYTLLKEIKKKIATLMQNAHSRLSQTSDLIIMSLKRPVGQVVYVLWNYTRHLYCFLEIYSH